MAAEAVGSVQKLYVRGSVRDIHDKFAEAEEQCDNVRKKINQIKKMKKIKFRKRRSMTTVNKHPIESEDGSSIAVGKLPRKTRRKQRKDQPAELFSKTGQQRHTYGQQSFSILDDIQKVPCKVEKPEAEPVMGLYYKNEASPTSHRLKSESTVKERTKSPNYVCGSSNNGAIPKSKRCNLYQSTSPLNSKREKNETKEPTENSVQKMNNEEIYHKKKHYEMPTIASQLKKSATVLYESETKESKIPFVSTTSTAPSHNVGVNVQKILSGLKVQQPLFGIPMTMAHRMGLGYVAPHKTKSDTTVETTSDKHELNAIKLGRHSIIWPTFRKISYNRLLRMYRTDDGVVSRFLRSVNQRRETNTFLYEDLPPALDNFKAIPKKNRRYNDKRHRLLEEYANFFKKYKCIENEIKHGNSDGELLPWQKELLPRADRKSETVDG